MLDGKALDIPDVDAQTRESVHSDRLTFSNRWEAETTLTNAAHMQAPFNVLGWK